MPQDLQQRYTIGRRIGKERRTTARYPFTATCDATEPKSHAKIIGRTSDLGRGGCFIDTIGPFPVGTVLVIRINRETQTLTIEGKVAFAQPGMGMGLAFTKAAPDQQAILDEWIAELSGEPVVKAEVAPEAAPAAPAAANGDGASAGDSQALFVMNELVLLLLQKGVLSPAEGKSLLQKLLK
jgi:hypothetical protein